MPGRLGRKGNFQKRFARPVGEFAPAPLLFFAGRRPYAASGYGSGDEFFSPEQRHYCSSGRTRFFRPPPVFASRCIIGKTKCAEIQNQMRLFGGRSSPKRKATKISHTHKKTPFERQSKAIRTVFCIRPNRGRLHLTRLNIHPRTRTPAPAPRSCRPSTPPAFGDSTSRR